MLKAPRALLDVTFAALCGCGGGRRECVAYWLGPSDDPSLVTDVVQPPHDAGSDWYEVDDQWLTAFFLRLRDVRQSVRAQVHTHPGAHVSHSKTDDAFPIAALPGTLSIVIPHFATQAPTLATAGVVEMTEGGRWERRVPSEVIEWI